MVWDEAKSEYVFAADAAPADASASARSRFFAAAPRQVGAKGRGPASVMKAKAAKKAAQPPAAPPPHEQLSAEDRGRVAAQAAAARKKATDALIAAVDARKRKEKAQQDAL